MKTHREDAQFATKWPLETRRILPATTSDKEPASGLKDSASLIHPVRRALARSRFMPLPTLLLSYFSYSPTLLRMRGMLQFGANGRVSELASGLTGNEVPGNRLRVQVPCPPLLFRQNRPLRFRVSLQRCHSFNSMICRLLSTAHRCSMESSVKSKPSNASVYWDAMDPARQP